MERATHEVVEAELLKGVVESGGDVLGGVGGVPELALRNEEKRVRTRKGRRRRMQRTVMKSSSRGTPESAIAERMAVWFW
jgi:hypothetical protein